MHNVEDLSAALIQKTAQVGLLWLSQHEEKLAFSTALGEEDQVITHMIAKGKLPIRIFTLDTGRLFNETYDLLDLTQKNYNVKVEVYFPQAQAVEKYVQDEGINGFYDSVENRKACCGIRKIEPLKRALQNTKVWITGLRSAQSENRQSMEKVSFDAGMQVIKYNPLLDWSDDELRNYIDVNNVPTNPLHKKGFLSIGCAPCTRALLPGEPLRAGRWWWEGTAKECGLHETKVLSKNTA
jgi:phosphoadenosine phosphosulfate reductase